MLSFLPSFIILPISLFCFTVNLALWGGLVTLAGIGKLLLPVPASQRQLFSTRALGLSTLVAAQQATD